MPTVWFSLKKSLHCKSEPGEVHDPHNLHGHKHHLTAVVTRKNRSGCSKSIANLKDVIHGNRRVAERALSSCSPRSIGSSEFLHPMSHEVIVNNSRCELKITGLAGYNGSNTVIGTLRPGTPGPGTPSYRRVAACHSSSEFSFAEYAPGSFNNTAPSTPRFSNDSEKELSSRASCQKCGEKYAKLEALEDHHIAKHAVTELLEGDSSRNIVEIIFRTSWMKTENPCGRIERVLKVHNTQKTLTRFEEYREMVKAKASKFPKKHPRCLADGNELLRFHGTTIMCSLGMNGSSSLCNLEGCNVCRIIRKGFSMKKEAGGRGIYTTATSGSAHDSIALCEDDLMFPVRKALLVCRVIAGRVHRPLDNFEEFSTPTGFDSVAGKVALLSNVEELFLLNPKALLPCFVIICNS
ncbi:hypothetical protein SUGI_0652030 [Cryptomeria japonica]|uniref:uncharacterized protein LOC131035673 n=1 Tax=Cryptomeria japonica TaxID=3369 RepID=UPI00241469F3|nr:uncharacterized protein LOC131035673 [Cryptomeria japonica]GLJ32401.1 hypothetical protein SUGI_0652030 [Cryptomeria japonica]